MPFICTVITGPTYLEARSQIDRISKFTDLLEFRLDLLKISIGEAGKLKDLLALPVIFTLRNDLEKLKAFAALEPDYIDLDNPEMIQEIQTQFPKIKIIYSHHDFNHTPHDLESLWQKQQKPGITHYKIACAAKNSHDMLRMVSFGRGKNLIPISMGEYGVPSRILAPCLGSPWTYACVDHPIAPGQLSAQTLHELYRLKKRNSQFYGLIGNPVEHSIGHLFHNEKILYVKMKIEELEHCFPYLKELFCGLSVTMPHKETILKHLDLIDSQAQEIGAVNTIHFHKGKAIGYNTDGEGALDALGDVQNQTIVILGAGGSAKAIAYAAKDRGAKLIILNRTLEKAKELALKVGGAWGDLETLPSYDILINTIPVDIKVDLHPNTTVMDIRSGYATTPLLETAKKKGCNTINFEKMFIAQALKQQQIWNKK